MTDAGRSGASVRAMLCESVGSPLGLRPGVLRLRPPRAHEVVVEVIAAGANYADGLMVSGAYQIAPTLPFAPGGELVGQVVEAGGPEGAELVGQRVLAMSLTGAFAERSVVRVVDCVPTSTGDPFVTASFAESYATARYALFDRGRLSSGETVVVTGAGSGVGLAAVNLAAGVGARPIAVASTAEKRSAALGVGAVAAIAPTADMRAQLAKALTTPADVVLDVVGGELAEALLRSLGSGGRYVTVGFASGQIPQLPLNHVLLRNRAVIGAELGSWARGNPEAHRSAVADLVRRLESGQLVVPPPTVYPLLAAGRALDDLLERRVVGRIAIDVAGGLAELDQVDG